MKSKSLKQNQKPSIPIKQTELKIWKAEDYVSETMTLDEVKGIKAAFDIFDSDRSGYVDPKEMKAAFVSLGLSNANKVVVNIMNGLQGEHPQGLSFSDFIHLSIGVVQSSHSRRHIDKIFNSFDCTQRGKINMEQFKQVALELQESLSIQEIQNIFFKTDNDEDGFITAEDFYNVLTHKKY